MSYEGSDEYIRLQFSVYFKSILYTLMKNTCQDNDYKEETEKDWSIEFDPCWFNMFRRSDVMEKWIESHKVYKEFINEPLKSQEMDENVYLEENSNLPSYLQPCLHPGHGATMLDDVKLRFKERFKSLDPFIQNASMAASAGISNATTMIDNAWNSEAKNNATKIIQDRSKSIMSGVSSFWSSAKAKLVRYIFYILV